MTEFGKTFASRRPFLAFQPFNASNVKVAFGRFAQFAATSCERPLSAPRRPSHRNQTRRRGGLAKRQLCAANPTIAKPMSAIAQVDGSGTDVRIVSVMVAEPSRVSLKPVSSI
jgi:hypothetical protein